MAAGRGAPRADGAVAHQCLRAARAPGKVFLFFNIFLQTLSRSLLLAHMRSDVHVDMRTNINVGTMRRHSRLSCGTVVIARQHVYTHVCIHV